MGVVNLCNFDQFFYPVLLFHLPDRLPDPLFQGDLRIILKIPFSY